MSTSASEDPVETIKKQLAEKENRRRIRERKNCFFEPLSEDDLEQHPILRQEQLKTIFDLATVKFKTYQESIDPNPTVQPWRRARLWRAANISEIARDLVACQDSEYGWRAKLEQQVLNPFTVESACEKCTGRFWASEISSRRQRTTAELDLNYEESRQKACECENRSQRHYLLNRLFQDKLDEPTLYDSELQAQIGKVERPDRIFGLRRPSGFETIQDKLEDIVKLSLHKQEANFLIFPFLILEAKSDKSKDNFEDINLQSSFAIMEALRIQYELFKAAEMLESKEYHGPLAWYIAYRGLDWKVYVAFTETQHEILKYKICEIWHGDLKHLNESLQLTLIIDHIADWARTTYRPDILHLIKMLILSMQATDPLVRSDAFRDTPWISSSKSAAKSIDISSGLIESLQQVQEENEELLRSEEVPAMESITIEDDEDEPKVLPVLYSDGHLLIQRPTIRTRLSRSICKASSLIDRIKSKRVQFDGDELSSSLWDLLESSTVLSGAELRNLELHWLGADRIDQSILKSLRRTKFLVAIRIQFDIDYDGDPIRELRYFAFDFACKEYLSLFMRIDEENNPVIKRPLKLDQIREIITDLHQQPPSSIIRACIMRKEAFASRASARMPWTTAFNTCGAATTWGFDHWIFNLKCAFEYLELIDDWRYAQLDSYVEVSYLEGLEGPHLDPIKKKTEVKSKRVYHGGWFSEYSCKQGSVQFCSRSHPSFYVFSDAEYNDDFTFDDTIQSTDGASDELEKTIKRSLRTLRKSYFPGLTDAQICGALIKLEGRPNPRIRVIP